MPQARVHRFYMDIMSDSSGIVTQIVLFDQNGFSFDDRDDRRGGHCVDYEAPISYGQFGEWRVS